MTIQEFKREAQRRGHFFDNSANAAKALARSWGMTYHSDLWFYKEYTMGNMKWKGGPVRHRHGSYSSIYCYIDGHLVSEYRFRKALESFEAPALTNEERNYIEQQQARIAAELALAARRRRTGNSRQLTLNFDVA